MRHGQALAGAVVATASVSVNADCDNGTMLRKYAWVQAARQKS